MYLEAKTLTNLLDSLSNLNLMQSVISAGMSIGFSRTMSTDRLNPCGKSTTLVPSHPWKMWNRIKKQQKSILAYVWSGL